MALAQVEADRASVTLRTNMPPAEPAASIDPQQIEQVLLNVVLNAIQASPPGGQVAIRESVESRDVLIDVSDEGPGVPDDDLSRIFSPFFTTREKGTGLGLAIAHRIVTTHGGSLDVMPRAAGRGGWFRIRLPIAGPRRQGRAELAPEAQP
jgi:signal transduction histidine kinase